MNTSPPPPAWKARLKRELWLAFVVFPATFFVGFLIQFLFSKEQQAAAVEYQKQLAADLFGFNPVALIWKIVQAAQSSISEWWQELSTGGWIMVIKLPIAIGRIPFVVIEDAWQTGSVLAGIVITITFLFGALIGFATASTQFERAGILAVVPGAGFALLLGSLVCTILWAVIWVALVLFGWFLVFAGYCAVVGGVLTGAGVSYLSFRFSRASKIEARLDSAGPA